MTLLFQPCWLAVDALVRLPAADSADSRPGDAVAAPAACAAAAEATGAAQVAAEAAPAGAGDGEQQEIVAEEEAELCLVFLVDGSGEGGRRLQVGGGTMAWRGEAGHCPLLGPNRSRGNGLTVTARASQHLGAGPAGQVRVLIGRWLAAARATTLVCDAAPAPPPYSCMEQGA